MWGEHVPERNTTTSSGAMIPGYDEGLVNQDAVIGGNDGSARRDLPGPGDVLRLSVVREVTDAQWGQSTGVRDASSRRSHWQPADRPAQTAGNAAELALFAVACLRLADSLARSRLLEGVSGRVVPAGRKLAGDIVRPLTRYTRRALRTTRSSLQL